MPSITLALSVALYQAAAWIRSAREHTPIDEADDLTRRLIAAEEAVGLLLAAQVAGGAGLSRALRVAWEAGRLYERATGTRGGPPHGMPRS